ncbi:type IV pilus biogenesis/stability protein PilW [Parashewanella curva]|uniref:Type IV pilus biogenesis/stability protein PilW n=1 Tax=Parashewanella curva TaxID=2338552 RepID=A0A3L8PZA9_9GAMM|nr:type IV pilus biogenesis/stability protein PilW [Parashewanella curva]RLV59933.1 type IV pilus biogenesis/stability protein PilW [Parashewanella curva]
MKQGWLIGCVVTALVLTSGCVTQRTYKGTERPVTDPGFNKDNAALERMQLGLTYLKRGNTEQAKYNLEKAMEYAPNLEEVHIAMAYYYQKVGDTARTERAYENAINSRNVTGDAYNNFGVFLCEQKKFNRSETMFLKAINMPKYTRTADSYENLGLCMEASGDLSKAAKYFELALKYDPRRANSLLELARIQLTLEQLPAAKAKLEQYHRVAIATPLSLQLGIDIARAQNDNDAVKHYGLTLLAKYPKSQQAKQYRASMH